MADLKQIPNCQQLTWADPHYQNYLISVQALRSPAGSPQPHYPEYFHWERLKHLNRS